MVTNRRAFLFGAASAALAAPAIVPLSSLMKLWVPPKPVLVTQLGQVYFMQGRQFFVYNGGDSPVHLSMPTQFGEWAVTVDPGEQRLIS